MAQRVRKITPEILKQIIVQEARKLQKESIEGIDRPEDLKADETEADEYADTLEKKVDHLKVLGIHENRLRAKLAQVQAAKAKILRARKSR